MRPEQSFCTTILKMNIINIISYRLPNAPPNVFPHLEHWRQPRWLRGSSPAACSRWWPPNARVWTHLNLWCLLAQVLPSPAGRHNAPILALLQGWCNCCFCARWSCCSVARVSGEPGRNWWRCHIPWRQLGGCSPPRNSGGPFLTSCRDLPPNRAANKYNFFIDTTFKW